MKKPNKDMIYKVLFMNISSKYKAARVIIPPTIVSRLMIVEGDYIKWCIEDGKITLQKYRR